MPVDAAIDPRSIGGEVARILGHQEQAGFRGIPRQEVNGLGLGKPVDKIPLTNGKGIPLGRTRLDPRGD